MQYYNLNALGSPIWNLLQSFGQKSHHSHIYCHQGYQQSNGSNNSLYFFAVKISLKFFEVNRLKLVNENSDCNCVGAVKIWTTSVEKKTKKGFIDENLNWPVVAATFRIRPIFFFLICNHFSRTVQKSGSRNMVQEIWFEKSG